MCCIPCLVLARTALPADPCCDVVQSLNPLPLVAMWANCVAWLVYSFITVDVYVLASNIPGLLLGSFMTITCYGFADEKVRVMAKQTMTGTAEQKLSLMCCPGCQ